MFGFETVYALTVEENRQSQQLMERLEMTFSEGIVTFRGRPDLLAFINQSQAQKRKF